VSRPGRVAVVVAGAGARGAYEAGALSVLLPALERAGSRPDLYVGTSAGAINAVLLAANAHLPAEQSAQALLEVWRGIGVSDVFRSLLRTGPVSLGRWAGQVLGVPGLRLHGFVDTAPLAATAQRVVDWPQLRRNVDDGIVDLAVVATSGATGRTVVFVDREGTGPLPPSDDARSIDYVAAGVAAEHVLASAAIPLLFPPVAVREPEGRCRWYVDGGVRLNTPLKPALALGADAVVVVATHPATCPRDPEAPPETGPPDVDDALVQLLDAALVDRMVEDLHTLGKLNEESPGGRARRVPYLFVAPDARGRLGTLAAQCFAQQYGGLRGALRSVARPDLPLAGRLLGGDGPRRGDLLSYLLFDPAFVTASIELGQRDAAATLDSGGIQWRSDRPAAVT